MQADTWPPDGQLLRSRSAPTALQAPRRRDNGALFPPFANDPVHRRALLSRLGKKPLVLMGALPFMTKHSPGTKQGRHRWDLRGNTGE